MIVAGVYVSAIASKTFTAWGLGWALYLFTHTNKSIKPLPG